MRAFCKKHPPIKSTDKTLKDAASLILAKESQTVVDFTVPECLKVPKKQATRFAPNPGKSMKSLFVLEGGQEGGSDLYVVRIVTHNFFYNMT